jgi:hypothetical protein
VVNRKNEETGKKDKPTLAQQLAEEEDEEAKPPIAEEKPARPVDL